MSHAVYNNPTSGTNGSAERLPTLGQLLYSSLDDIDIFLSEKPQFRDGFLRIISVMVGHECRQLHSRQRQAGGRYA